MDKTMEVHDVLMHWQGIPVRVSGEVTGNSANWRLILEGMVSPKAQDTAEAAPTG